MTLLCDAQQMEQRLKPAQAMKKSAVCSGAVNACVTITFLPIKFLITRIFSITLYNKAASK